MSVSTHIYSYPEVGVALKLDIYFGPPSQVPRHPVPAVVFFHGGSLLAGNREFLCKDIKRDTLSRGWAFISSDYRLLIPSTGQEILRDVKSLFSFLACNLNRELGSLGCPHQIDPQRLFVGGSSAGAYPAMLAALFAQPRPKGFFSLYGVGGDMLSREYLPKLKDDESELEDIPNGNAEQSNGGENREMEIKTEIDEKRYSLTTSHPIESPREILSVTEVVGQNPDLQKFLRPTPEEKSKMRSVADVPFSWAPMMLMSGNGGLRAMPSSSASSLSSLSSSNSSASSSSSTPKTSPTSIFSSGSITASSKNEPSDLIPGTLVPGHRARISGKLRAALFKTGTFLDILTGIRGISDNLSTIQSYSGRCEYVKNSGEAKYLFPQLWVDRNFPPSIIIHGDQDPVVSVKESQRMVATLEREGADVVFLVAEGKGHQFEERASPEVYVKYIKKVVEFLGRLG